MLRFKIPDAARCAASFCPPGPASSGDNHAPRAAAPPVRPALLPADEEGAA